MISLSSPELLKISPELIRHFEWSSRDYRLYPEIEYFVESFDENQYKTWLAEYRLGLSRKPFSIHVYIPSFEFLRHGSCSVASAEKTNSITTRYFNDLIGEIVLRSKLHADDAKVEQVYCGGSVLEFFDIERLSTIMDKIREHFDLAHDCEAMIEIDARAISDLAGLRKLGFNCVVMSIYDFDHDVQLATQSMQTEEATLGMILKVREAGFGQIRIELVYGLPRQGVSQFEYTLNKIIAACPCQIHLLNYVCESDFGEMKHRIDIQDLPNSEARLEMIQLAIFQLTDAGYVHIGMHVFARMDNPLVIAQRQGRLHYGIQGYSVFPDCYRIALGVSSIGSMGPTFNQNCSSLLEYSDRVERNALPIMRGIQLSADDLMRRSVIHALICHQVLSFESVETFFPIEFKRYFSTELTELARYAAAGLVELTDDEIVVTPLGQLLIDSVCGVFDKYLRARQSSKVNCFTLNSL